MPHLALLRSAVVAACALTALMSLSGCGDEEVEAVTVLQMSTGGVRGVYYPVGRGVAARVNDRQRELDLHISVGASHGSIENLNLLASGRVDLAIVQLDLLLRARAGEGFWEGHPQTDLRALGLLYTEAITLLVPSTSDVHQVSDLPGRRLNVGPEGSGHRHSAMAVLTAAGIDPSQEQLGRLGPRQGMAALGGEVDVSFLTIGHPAPLIQRRIEDGMPMRLLPIDGALREAMLAADPALVATSIDSAVYGFSDGIVPTVGVGAVLVCRADLPAATARAVVASVLNGEGDLADLHPVLGSLNQDVLTGLNRELYHDGLGDLFP